MNVASPSTVEAPIASSVRTVPVYQALAEDLRAIGVERCFGLMSDDTIGLVVALDALGVRFNAIRHETNSVLAAEGYGRLDTGRLELGGGRAGKGC